MNVEHDMSTTLSAWRARFGRHAASIKVIDIRSPDKRTLGSDMCARNDAGADKHDAPTASRCQCKVVREIRFESSSAGWCGAEVVSRANRLARLLAGLALSASSSAERCTGS